MKYFASDNNSGAHPEIMQALQQANSGYAPSYGDDEITAETVKLFQKEFSADTRAYFVFAGTAANVLGLKAVLLPHEAVICSAIAHINTDECGAIEAHGRKLYPIMHHSGKIRVDDCQPLLGLMNDIHRAGPKVVSITQSTELGTVYTTDEIKELADFCHANDLYLHVDGARIANAAAALNVSLAEITCEAGVDFMSFGGTKNGLLYGEAILFFNPELARYFPFLHKQGMQLASKMRFITAQFSAYLKHELWRKNAAHANEMARLLVSELEGISKLEFTRPVEVNAVFARLPEPVIEKLLARYKFYIWDDNPDQLCPAEPGESEGLDRRPEVRLMTSFDTSRKDVLEFAAAIRELLQA